MSGILARDRRSGEGFTLIELLITVLILAILVTIVVMTMSIAKEKTQEAACKANLKIIYSSIQQYYTNHSGAQYPPDLETLKQPPEKYLKESVQFECPGGAGNYVYSSATGLVTCPKASHNP